MANKINVVLGLDSGEFTTGLNVASKKLEQTSKKFTDVGTTLSIAFTAPFAILAKTASDAFNTQAKAVAQIEAGLKSTGNTFSFTSQQLQQLASDLQDVSLFGDEQILQDVTAQFLTFGNIADENFQRAQQAALDFATRIDGDLKGASIQLGKALQDPIKGINALSKSGVSFSAEQKTLIKSLAETGRVAEAQRIILGELEKQYGGSAKAAAEAGTGPIEQARMAFGDLLEVVGKVVVEGITPFAIKLKEFFKLLQTVNPAVTKFAVGFGAVLAAVGPLLLGIGGLLKLFASMTKTLGAIIPLIKSLAAAFNLATLKITLIVGAILAVIAGLIYLYNNFESVRRVVNGVIDTFVELFKILKEGAGNVFKGIGKILAGEFTEGGRLLVDGLIKTNPIGIAATQGKRLAESFNKGYEDETNRLAGISDKIKSFLFLDPISVDVEPKVKPFVATPRPDAAGGKGNQPDYTPFIDSGIAKLTQKVLADVNKRAEDGFKATRAAVEGYRSSLAAIPNVVSPIEKTREALAKYDTQIKNSEATLKIFGATQDEILRNKISITEQNIAAAVEAFGAESAAVQDLIDQYIELKKKRDEENAGKEAQIKLQEALGSAIQQAGQIIGQSLEEQALSFKTLAQSVLQAAKTIIKALIQEGVAGFIKNILAGPTGKTLPPPVVLGIAAAGGAIASGIFSAAIGRIGVPKLARGGLVTGQQLAIVGDNPSGKEAIIPFERMGEFLDMVDGGSNRISGLFEVRGQDLVLVLDRATQSKNRIR